MAVSFTLELWQRLYMLTQDSPWSVLVLSEIKTPASFLLGFMLLRLFFHLSYCSFMLLCVFHMV